MIGSIPPFNAATLPRPLLSTPFDTAQNIVARYNAVYPDESEGPSGCCTDCGTDVGMMYCALFPNGTPIAPPSWPFGHYSSTGDATFTEGGDVGWKILARMRPNIGVCLDSLYPAAILLANWPNGFPYNTLPSPAAYADAQTRWITKASQLPASPLPGGPLVDIDLLGQLLESGYGVVVETRTHAFGFIAYDRASGIYMAKDSENAGIDQGYGRGVRGWQRAALETELYAAFVIESIEYPLTQGVAVTPDQVLAAIPTIQWSAAQYAQLQTVAAAAPHQPPVQPTGSTIITPPSPIPPDAVGNAWTWGAFVSDRFGYQLILGGRGLKTVTAVAIVSGVLRANDVGSGGWYAFTGTAAAPAWTPTSAP